jgi:hypothetical protein
MPKGPVCPKFSISSTRPCSDSRNSEIIDRLESENEPSESGESYPKASNLVFSLAAVLSRTDFSNVIVAQNSITSKPLVIWDCISNG